MDPQRACSTGELTSDGCGLVGGGRAMHHSHSTPAGVDGGARTPPTTPKKAGKMLAVRVQMLDDTITMFQIQAKALGRVLFDQVCKQLHLLEADYFGLEYQDLAGTRYWLDLQKAVSRQLGLSLVDPLLRFCVKFYTPDPGQLEEEFTRYLFCLQMKRDLSQGHLQCNDNTAALMASYIVQAECGDFVSEDYPDHTYLSSYKFVPHQDHELECRIMENHKKHAGQSPAEADLNLLETARRCELYGMKMHPAKDHEGVALNLSVAHMGIVVFQHYSKINTFSWAKIRKISFKRKRFLIKLHPEGYGYYKDLVEFYFEGRNECKNFWKKCVEHHGFFRCSAVKHVTRHKTRVLSRGSSFRYSGKTQKQMVEFVRDNYVKRQTFQRSASFRHSAHSSAVNVHAASVGTSISAHPLLPLADPSLAEELDKASRMEAARALGVSPMTRAAFRRPVIVTRSPHNSITLCTSPDSPKVRVEDTRVTMSSPSPLPTTQSVMVSVEICTNTNRALAVENMVGGHDDDTGNTGQTSIRASFITHTTTIPPTCSNASKTSLTASSQSTNKYTPKSEGSLHHLTPDTTSSYSQTNKFMQTRENFEYNQTLPKSYTECKNEYSYTHLQNKARTQPWQRSVSCRELYDLSYKSASEKTNKSHKKPEKSYSEERKLESPITRYDDSHKSLYNAHSSRNTSLDIHQDIIILDHKIYSSSYPGTVTLSQESMEDPGNYELAESQDDLSHDSYELLERSDDDYSTSGAYRYRHSYPSDKTRSGSLDSGNYIQSVSDSDSDDLQRYKSTSDVHQDIFLMDDPRDLPRETNPPKSDGAFYRHVKLSSRTSSLESKSDYYDSMSSSKKLSKVSSGSRTSSLESKSDRETKQTRKSSENVSQNVAPTSITDSYITETASFTFPALNNDQAFASHGIQQVNNSEFNSSTDYDSFPILKETTHVHSVSLQNVETEQNIRNHRALLESEINTLPKTQKSNSKSQTTHIWPESICGLPTEILNWPDSKSAPVHGSKPIAQLESNIFSFDDDKIRELKDSDYAEGLSDPYPYPPLPLLEPDFPDPLIPDDFPKDPIEMVNEYKDKCLAKMTDQLIENDVPVYSSHPPIERTKSDPNTVTNRQRLGSSSRRHTLMHQKSIDLTPAESSDEDYIYRQIPSAPPLSKSLASRFEMPTAEFGHFDILQREVEGAKTKFEVPKSQFEVLGAKTQFDLINLPPKDSFDIPYILHKRHVMNGTAPKVDSTFLPKEPNKIDSPIEKHKRKLSSELSPKILKPETTHNEKKVLGLEETSPQSAFLFTQNVDLSNINPITLEIDKNDLPIHHMASPKRDITKIDPSVLETLNMKLSRIESDSPPLNEKHTIVEDIKTHAIKLESKHKIDAKSIFKSKYSSEPQLISKGRNGKDFSKDGKPKRIIKPRSQSGKKGVAKNKGKIRITSFSSDDESLDSDDVFGSTEATPTKLEFSPPQHRKEMESILKFESERQTHLQYTMSSTEIEGSPPQPRKTDSLPYDRSLDTGHTELRRISERSLSIPSSEDDVNLKPERTLLPSVPDETFLETRRSNADDDTDDKTVDSQITDQKEQITVLENLGPINIEEIPLPPEIEPVMTKVSDSSTSQSKLKSFLADVDSSISRRGQSPGLFAHARLNLSEGSGFTAMQRQTQVQSPTSSRRAKSLDTAVVSVINLPPPTAFSSKDDTVDSSESPKLKEKDTSLKLIPPLLVDSSNKNEKTIKKSVDGSTESKPPLTVKSSKLLSPKSENKKGLSLKLPSQQSGDKKTPRGQISKDRSLEKQKSPKLKISSQLRPTRSQESEQTKRTQPKEKSKSFEKLELKRISSKERSKSQDDNEMSSAKRKEKQQMLYETAIKQTKTLKSPVKEMLPPFPVVEDSVSVSDGKLEIKIDVTNFTIPDDAIIITKSPKKLDKKLTKSLELNFPDDPFGTDKQVGRLGKSLDLEQRKPEVDSDSKPGFSTEAGDTSEETSDIESDTNDPIQPTYSDDLSATEVIGNVEIPDLAKEINSNDLDKPIMEMSFITPIIVTDLLEEVLEETAKFTDTLNLDKKSSLSIDMSKVIPKITSEEESLTDVSDIKGEILKKMSAERSKSEDTTSWMTVECEEVIGMEDEDISLNEEEIIPEDTNLLHTQGSNKNKLLKFSDTRSRSSDTTGSWTSGEKDTSPVTQHKELKSDESSVSCSIIRPFGISQHIEKYDTREQLESELLRNLTQEDNVLPQAHSSDSDKGPRSPLKRTSPVDEESSSGSNGHVKPIALPKTVKKPLQNTKTDSKSSTDTSSLTSFEADGTAKVIKGKYPFEQKWLSEAELQKGNLKVPSKATPASDKSTYSSLDESVSEKNKNGSLDKPRIQSIDKLSVESKNSLDTESSSGSLGAAVRLQKTGEAPLQEASSTWRPFLMESSGSSSLEDGILPPDYDIEDKEYYITSDSYKLKPDDDDEIPNLDATFVDVNTHFGYPCMSATLGSIGITSSDILPNYGTSYLARTLSRISERSSNSEKSSLEENSSKHSTHYDSMNEESLVSSDQQASLSSDPSSNDKTGLNAGSSGGEKSKVVLSSEVTRKKSSSSSFEQSPSNLKNSAEKFKSTSLLGSHLQRQISDDRRTSAEMADISLDDVELVMAEDKLLRRQNSDDTIIEENSDCETPQLKPSSSQESEDWPLPEIPTVAGTSNSRESIDNTSPPETIAMLSDQFYVVPKIFGLRGSLQSEDSGQWPSPPSSGVFDPPFVGNVETYYMQPEEAYKVIVPDSVSDATPDYDNEVFLENPDTRTTTDEQLDDNSPKPSSSSGSDESASGIATNEIVLDTKYSSEEEEKHPPPTRRKHSMLSKQASIRVSHSSEDENSNSNDNVTKSAGFSLSESNMTTVLFQNLSGSYSGTSKSLKGPGGVKDDDSSLFDNLSLSEWSSSNSHPLGPNSPLSKNVPHEPTAESTNAGKSTPPDSQVAKPYTKSTERPVKIPQFFSPEKQISSTSLPLSPEADIDSNKQLQKSVSYDNALSSENSKPNIHFKTVPLIRSHRGKTRGAKKSHTDSALGSGTSVVATREQERKLRKLHTSNQAKKMKIMRQKSSDRLQTDSESGSRSD